MQLLVDPKAPTLQFGRSPAVQPFARGLALLSGGALLWLACAVRPGSPLFQAGLAIAATGLVVSWALAQWQDLLTIEVDSRRLRRQRGLPPFARVRQESLPEHVRLVLRSETRPNLYGDPVDRSTLVLAGAGPPTTLYRNVADPRGREITECLAQRLRLPLEPAAPPRKRRLIPGWALPGLLWCCAAVILVGQFWPSGDRPQAGFAAGPIDPVRARFDHAVTLYFNSQFRQAEEELRKVLAQRGDMVEAYNMLAYTLADQQRLDEALAAAEQALRRAQWEPNILDTVAEMHQRRKEWKAAVSYYNRAIAASVPYVDMETRVKYAQCLLALGRRPAAIVQLQQARQHGKRLWANRAAMLLQRIQNSSDPLREEDYLPTFSTGRTSTDPNP